MRKRRALQFTSQHESPRHLSSHWKMVPLTYDGTSLMISEPRVVTLGCEEVAVQLEADCTAAMGRTPVVDCHEVERPIGPTTRPRPELPVRTRSSSGSSVANTRHSAVRLAEY